MRSVDLKISPMLKKPPLKMLERYLHTTDRMMHRWPPFLDRGSSHIVLSAYLYRRLLYDLVDELYNKSFPCYQYN